MALSGWISFPKRITQTCQMTKRMHQDQFNIISGLLWHYVTFLLILKNECTQIHMVAETTKLCLNLVFFYRIATVLTPTSQNTLRPIHIARSLTVFYFSFNWALLWLRCCSCDKKQNYEIKFFFVVLNNKTLNKMGDSCFSHQCCFGVIISKTNSRPCCSTLLHNILYLRDC